VATNATISTPAVSVSTDHLRWPMARHHRELSFSGWALEHTLPLRLCDSATLRLRRRVGHLGPCPVCRPATTGSARTARAPARLRDQQTHLIDDDLDQSDPFEESMCAYSD